MRKLISIAGTVVIIIAAVLVAQRAKPNPLTPPAGNPASAPQAQSNGPTISWSSPQLAATMFPGASSTVTVTFKSSESLGAVSVWVPPSLNGIVSANPAIFASIAANQPYQITFSLTAPPDFIKRSFGGTIHIRDAGTPPKTYAQPLNVNLQTDYATVSNPALAFTMAYPVAWSSQQASDSSSVIITNTPTFQPISDTSLANDSFFRISRLGGAPPGSGNAPPANPAQLPIDLWFGQYFSGGVSVPPLSQTIVTVANNPALSIVVPEVGGKRLHVFVPNGRDVLEIEFGQFPAQYVSTYEAMLNSIQF